MDLSHGAPAEERSVEGSSRFDDSRDKGVMTEIGMEVTSLGVQIHGGMGYVEETGAAQCLRDVRITPIYEGTNGIQAADLSIVSWPVMAAPQWKQCRSRSLRWLTRLRDLAMIVLRRWAPRYLTPCRRTSCLHRPSSRCSKWTKTRLWRRPDCMMQTGYLFGGWHLAASSLVAIELLAKDEKTLFCQRKIATTEFYLSNYAARQCARRCCFVAAVSWTLTPRIGCSVNVS